MKWEYKTMRLPMTGILKKTIDVEGIERTLNRLGEEAWELVSVFVSNIGFGETNEVVAIFKRPAS